MGPSESACWSMTTVCGCLIARAYPAICFPSAHQKIHLCVAGPWINTPAPKCCALFSARSFFTFVCSNATLTLDGNHDVIGHAMVSASGCVSYLGLGLSCALRRLASDSFEPYYICCVCIAYMRVCARTPYVCTNRPRFRSSGRSFRRPCTLLMIWNRSVGLWMRCVWLCSSCTGALDGQHEAQMLHTHPLLCDMGMFRWTERVRRIASRSFIRIQR